MTSGIPGVVNEYGQPAIGKLTEAPNAKGLGKFAFRRVCPRCGGLGGSDKWLATGWTCFACGGSGKGDMKEARCYTPEAFAKLEERRVKREAKKAAEKAAADAVLAAEFKARADEFAAANPGLLGALRARRDEKVPGGAESFLASLARQLEERGFLTQAQVDAATAAIEREVERAAKFARMQFLGKEGDVIEANVKNIRTVDVSYGSFPRIEKYLVILETEEGNQIKYVGTSSAVPYAPDEGWVKVKAKIKGLENYNGKLQTVIERPRAVK